MRATALRTCSSGVEPCTASRASSPGWAAAGLHADLVRLHACSLCRFFELTGHYPSSLVVVSYDFKRPRMLEEHRRALRWPAERMTFLGSPALMPDAVQVGGGCQRLRGLACMMRA